MPELDLLLNPEPAPVPYIFRVGVTGHRYLTDPESVTVAVDTVLSRLNAMMHNPVTNPYQPQVICHSALRRAETDIVCAIKRLLAFAGILKRETPPARRTEIKWHLVSSLAKGADTIVTRRAMDSLGASPEVILPFRTEDYLMDFTDAGTAESFKLLYEKATPRSKYSFESEPAPGDRSTGYLRAGEAMVQSSEVIIAIWDGKPGHGKGGTAETVEYALSLNRPVIWINVSDKVFPAYLITSIEKGRDGGEYTVRKKRFPKNTVEISRQFLQVAEYNRDQSLSGRAFRKAYEENRERLERAGVKAGLSEGSVDGLLKEILSHYTRADQLADRYQKIHARSAKWLYRLSTIAVIVAVVQALFVPDQTGWIILEILTLLTAFLWYRLGITENWHEKWLDYRHLAERLRMLIFSGILKSNSNLKGSTSVQSLPFYQGPGEWVLKVLDHVQGLLPGPEGFKSEFQPVKDFILTGLIHDQALYYSATARKKAGKIKTENRFIGVLLVVILLAATMHLFKLSQGVLFENIIVTLVVALPAIAASQHAIGSIHDYERISSRSEHMAEILKRIEKSVEKTNTFEELLREIRNAEDIMSTENHEWCVSLSFRRISLPV